MFVDFRKGYKMVSTIDQISLLNKFKYLENIVMLWGKEIIYICVCLVAIWLCYKCKLGKVKLVEFAFHIIVATLLGILIKRVAPDTIVIGFTNNYEVTFILFLFISIIFIKEILTYTNTIKQIMRNYIRALYLFILIIYIFSIVLHSNYYLIIGEALTLFYLFLLYNTEGAVKKSKVENYELSDMPIDSFDDLFPTRKIEFNRIYKYINELEIDDPYAIAINAEWGEGKTSFVNALQEKMILEENKKNNIIFIQPMILENQEKLLKYVFNQLELILNNNNIFTGKGSPYKEYFDLLLKFLNYKSVSNLSNFFDVLLEKDQKLDLREYKRELEKNIDILIAKNQKIYIVIDDLDRVEEHTVREALTFIKEIVNLRGTTVLFLVDYKKLISSNISLEYLEKFINKKFDLTKINKEEVISHYLEKIIPDYSLSETNEEIKILKDNYLNYLEAINRYILESLKRLDKIIEENESKEEKTVDDFLKKKEELQSLFEDYRNKMSNARYLKKIVTGIKENFNYFNDSLIRAVEGPLNFEYKNIEIGQLILKINIFKILFKEQYDELIKIGDINNFVSNSESEFIKSFFRESEKSIIMFENEELIIRMKNDFYNSIIFSDPISDEIYQEIKTDRQKIMELLDSSVELNYESFNNEKLIKYIHAFNSASGYEDDENNKFRIKKISSLIIKLLMENRIKLINAFQVFGESNRNRLVDYPYYYERLNEYLKQNLVEFETVKERNASLHYLNSIEFPILSKNLKFIITLLDIYFLEDDKYSYSSLQESLQNTYRVDELNKSLYEILNINPLNVSTIDDFNFIINHVKENIEKNHNDNDLLFRALIHNHESIVTFIRIIKALNELTEIAKIIPLNSDASFEIVIETSEQELVMHLNRLYEYLKENPSDPSKINYRIFRFFHSLVNNIYSSFHGNNKFDKEGFLKLKEISDVLDVAFENNKTEYDSSSWYYCLIVIAKIEKKIFPTQNE